MVIESDVSNRLSEHLVPSMVQSNIANEVRKDGRSLKPYSPQLRMSSDSSPRRAIGDGGYNLSKSYTFKCTGCEGSFIKLMIVELTHGEAEALSKYKVQQLFNSSTNATATCPYCGRRVGLILSSNLMIGGKK